MKKFLLLSITIITLYSVANAQDIKDERTIFDDEVLLLQQMDYYSGKTEVKGNEITFVVDDYHDNSNFPYVKIYNIDYALMESADPVDENGDEVGRGWLPKIRVDELLAESIVYSSITPSNIRMLSNTGKGYLRVLMHINPKSGRVMKVYFTFFLSHGGVEMLAISPWELEKMEKLLKEQLVCEIPDRWKGLSFLFAAFHIKTDNRIYITYTK